MIDYNAIDIHWIEKVSKANRKADMTLVEKTIRAFVLLEGLATAGLQLICIFAALIRKRKPPKPHIPESSNIEIHNNTLT